MSVTTVDFGLVAIFFWGRGGGFRILFISTDRVAKHKFIISFFFNES